MDHLTEIPYPCPLMRLGTADQLRYPVEPAQPSRTETGVLVKSTSESNGVLPPRSFGPLYKAYSLSETRSYRARQTIFIRRVKGPIEHGIQRTDAAAYEKAKFNILLYPGQDEHNNCEYGSGSTHWRDMGEHWQKMLREVTMWPQVKRAPTVAPLMQAECGFDQAEVAQPNQFLRKFCQRPEVFEVFLDHVISRWEDVSNLSRTCQFVFKALKRSVMHCDMTGGNMLGISLTEEQVAARAARLEREGKPAEHVAVGPFLIISPVRRTNDEGPALLNDYRLNQWGYLDSDGTHISAPSDDDIFGLHLKLYRAMTFRSDKFRHLLLQRLRFVDVHALRAVIKTLPNLETLGVHNCEMVHFGKTYDLIKMVQEENERRQAKNERHREERRQKERERRQKELEEREAEKQEAGNEADKGEEDDKYDPEAIRYDQDDQDMLELDFYPTYFQGRLEHCEGTYGVVPYDMGHLNTIRGVVAVLLHVVPMAKKAVIDLLTPGKAFRRWLDKIPFALDCLPHLLEAILNLIDYRDGVHGTISNPQLKKDMEFTLWSDIIIATNGAPMQTRELQPMLFPRNSFRTVLVTCGGCGVELPAYFFTYGNVGRQAADMRCHGCELVHYLDNHKYRMHDEYSLAVGKMFQEDKIEDMHALWKGPAVPSPDLSDSASAPMPKYPWRIRQAMRDMEVAVRRYELYNEAINNVLYQRIEELRAQIARAGPWHPGMLKTEEEIRKCKNKLHRFLLYTGRGQWSTPVNSRETAASWQKRVNDYRTSLFVQTGQLQNNGPYELRDPWAFDQDCSGFW